MENKGKTADVPVDEGRALVRIIEETCDPLCTRVSLGGRDGEYYLVYRGQAEEVDKILKLAVEGFGKFRKEQA